MMTGSQHLCPQCGGRLLGGDRFCAHCGAPQDDSHPGLADPAAVAAWDAVLEDLRAATVGRYEIGRMLGAGGMAAVFLGREIKLPRRVAIKVMSPALMLAPGMIDRFRREAATMAALNHPNIVTIYTVDETERLQYFVMKYVSGPSLEAMVQKHGRLPVAVATAWLSQIAGGLGYAHRRGVIHRDVKPANILLDEEGTAIVTDFGIAKVVRDRSLTQVGATVGTPAYMSPEQCLSREVTAAADQYSLGIVAYELLTGEPPFTGPSLEVMQAHVQQRPPPIAVTRPDCPGELQSAIARMLAKDPDERWPSMEDAMVAMGGRPLGHDDPLRVQLAELAGGRPPSLVVSVPSPRSPLPTPRSPLPTPRSPVPAAVAAPVRVA
ncbi:MAG: protein kinase domain-containing protein, partial [Acidimicrobiales bacterium]